MILENGIADQENQSGPQRWYALHTRARHEKRVNLRLEEGGVEAFLPLVPRERRWHDRRKVVEWPIFPGYVFARFGAGTLTRVLSTPGVAAVVRFNGRPAPILDEDIDNVRRLIVGISEVAEISEPSPYIEEGRRVKIVAGSLKGVEGRVVERRGRRRALVQVGLRAIGQGVKLDIDVTSLRAIDGHD